MCCPFPHFRHALTGRSAGRYPFVVHSITKAGTGAAVGAKADHSVTAGSPVMMAVVGQVLHHNVCPFRIPNEQSQLQQTFVI